MGDYNVILPSRHGNAQAHRHRLSTANDLRVGDVVRVTGGRWIVDELREAGGEREARLEPARFRVVLLQPDGREEAGAVRRLRDDSLGVGHAFTTADETGTHRLRWDVVADRFVRDEGGRPLIEFVAEHGLHGRERVPDHELEHRFAQQGDLAEARAALEFATAAGLAVELVELEPDRDPDWDEARALLEALVIEEVGEDLLERCGIKPERDLPETWIDLVRLRLRADLTSFRGDVEGPHRQIHEWHIGPRRVFASIGTWESEADPDSGHGWLCRLVDGDVLGAAGFVRLREIEL
jgi:hypothetical protein